MGYRTLEECVRALAAQGELKTVSEPVDPCLEMAAIQRRAFKNRAPALLFTNPKNCRFPMLANLFGTRERVGFIFRDGIENIRTIFQGRANPRLLMRKPFKTMRLLPALFKARPKFPKMSSTAHARDCAPVLANKCYKGDLPKLKSWPQDGGAFITLPLVYSEDPACGAANLGMYRVQLDGNQYANNEAGMHYQLKRGIGIHHAHAISQKTGLPVHVYAGGSPALALAAVMPLPEGMDELLFAALLGNHEIRRARVPGFKLPVLADCDFLLAGHISAVLKPEGPFGDHVGYYSLRHDFPVFRIDGVYHRNNAIWPFTSVGRPPQEDTVFGDFIHELTAPLVANVFPGVKEVHAVDAAGVHPLLLALGEERYTAYEATRKPRELLTLAMHLLGSTQTALAKYLLIAATEDAPGLSARDIRAFFRHMLERANFSTDLHFFTRSSTDTLDYTGTGLNEGSKLLWSSAGPGRRRLATEVQLPQLPAEFKNPVMVDAGILALQGPPHSAARGETDDETLEPLLHALENWSEREGFPLVVVVDDPLFCAKSFDNFLWIAFTRTDPATDIYGAFATTKAKHWSCKAPLVLDARRKAFHAPPLEDDPSVIERIEKLAVRGGPLYGII